jgi:hypothetical protein
MVGYCDLPDAATGVGNCNINMLSSYAPPLSLEPSQPFILKPVFGLLSGSAEPRPSRLAQLSLDRA